MEEGGGGEGGGDNLLWWWLQVREGYGEREGWRSSDGGTEHRLSAVAKETTIKKCGHGAFFFILACVENEIKL